VAEFLVRLADARDFAVVSDLYRRSSLSNEGDREVLLAHPETLVFEDTSIREGRTHVAVADHRIVGFVTTRAVGDIVDLEDLFVDPDWMRRGVARVLVLDAMTRVRAAGAKTIEVTANPHALDFYENVGFVADGATETQFGVGTRMHLNLHE
jgi:GNAT superfamily N-acetyltransferase